MPPDIRKSLKSFAPIFIEARKAGVKEADTVLRLCKFFKEVLGYDDLEDITSEAKMKEKYVDLCLKVDGRVHLLVEAKAACQKLYDKHIEQAQSYAAENCFNWVLLTNGVSWHLYHLTFDSGIEYVRAFVVSLDTPEGIDDAAEKLAFLHKQAIRKDELESFWEKFTALSAASIGRALFTEGVLMRLRRQIRKDTKLLIHSEDLAKSVHDMLSIEAREQIGPWRIRKSKPKKKKPQPTQPSPSTPTE